MGLILLAEQAVGLGEVAAADEAAMGGQRAGMGSAQHMVARPVDEAALLLGVGPTAGRPPLATGVDLLDDPCR